MEDHTHDAGLISSHSSVIQAGTDSSDTEIQFITRATTIAFFGDHQITTRIAPANRTATNNAIR